MKIIGTHVYLRSIRITDINALVKYANNTSVSQWMGPHFPYPYKRIDARRFISDTREKQRKKQAKRFAIVSKSTKELIGMIGFESIDKEHKRAEFGYWLAQDFWGQGIMSEVVELMIHYGFTQQKLHKLYARVYGENIPSMKLLKKYGFQQEGVFREHQYEYKKWHNMHYFGLLASDLKKKR